VSAAQHAPEVGRLTKTQRSILLYAECCLVDRGGLLEGVRMNADDVNELKAFAQAGVLEFGRIPAALLKEGSVRAPIPTHWVRFTDQAWELAAACRRLSAQRRGPYATSVFAEVEARNVSEATGRAA
jgi:hypothetical protein